jgi:hypothetical protein
MVFPLLEARDGRAEAGSYLRAMRMGSFGECVLDHPRFSAAARHDLGALRDRTESFLTSLGLARVQRPHAHHLAGASDHAARRASLLREDATTPSKKPERRDEVVQHLPPGLHDRPVVRPSASPWASKRASGARRRGK